MRAKKFLGQNFLVDRNVQRKIVETLDAGPDDEVLEIGPGHGALTRHLAGRVRRLVAVELDRELVEELRRDYGGVPGVEIVSGDILEMQLEALAEDPAALKVVGNIPYNITSPILFWLLEQPTRPARIVVMVQREVADRILAEPGQKAYGALSVGVRMVADVERAFNVSRGSFRPVPDVESTVVRITPRHPAPLTRQEERDVRSLVRTAFSLRRKQFQKILRSAPGYRLDRDELAQVEQATGLDLRRRPETLSPGDFVGLARQLRALGRPHDQAT